MGASGNRYVPNELLARLFGDRMYSVEFVLNDYVQFRFDGPPGAGPVTFNSYVWPVVHLDGRAWREPDHGYADALRKLTPGTVVSTTEETGSGIRLELTTGTLEIHPAKEEVFVEIAEISGFADGRWMDWTASKTSCDRPAPPVRFAAPDKIAPKHTSVGGLVKRFALASAAVAAALLVGCAQTTPAGAPAGQSPTAQPTTPATKPAAALTTVSILSDSHAYSEDSWWRQTVVANKVPGLTVGTFESHPGYTTADLLSYLDAAASKKGKVIVQAGTNDLLLRGSTAAAAAAGVEKLWQGIRDRGAVPVASLVPPANARPAEAVQLNALIRQAAEAQKITVIDVYTPVANKDGSWADGLTDDGIHSNKAGSDLMAAAAMKQLPSLAD